MAYRRRAARPSTAAKPAPEAATRLPAPWKELGDGEAGLTGTTDADGTEVAVPTGGGTTTEELIGKGGMMLEATAVVETIGTAVPTGVEEMIGTAGVVETTGTADGVTLTGTVVPTEVGITGLVTVQGQLVIVKVVASVTV